MKAKLTTQNQNARNLANEKETVREMHVVALKGGKIHHPVVARFYMGRSAQASTVYCSVWISKPGEIRKDGEGYTDGFYTSGRGSAGGYGYHKESAALASALSSAGVELYGSPYGRDEKPVRMTAKHRCYIGGCGDRSMEDALKAVAVALGYTGQLMVIG